MGQFSDKILDKPKQTGSFSEQILKQSDERLEANKGAFFNQSRIEPSDLSPGLRFSIARGDNLEEKNRLFKRRFPKGSVQRVPVTGELVYKRNTEDPNELFKQIERPGFDVAGDVAEFAGENIGPIAGEVAAASIPALRGAGLARFALAEGAGAATGEAAEQGIQQLQGVNTQSLQDVGKQSGTEGVIGGTGSLAFSAAARPLLNLTRGSGIFKQRPGAIEAEEARQFINQQIPGQEIRPFTPGQVVETPVLQRLDEQSIALAGGLRQQRRDQISSLGRATRRAANPRDLVRSIDNTKRAFEAENRKIVNAIGGSGDFDDAGVALADSLQRYTKNSQQQVSSLYDDASQLAPEGPAFDLSEALGVAGNLDAGVRAAATEGGEVNVQGALAPELRSVISDLRAIDPSFPAGENIAPAWQVLDNLRQRLFDLKTPNPGETFRRSHRQANELYQSITRTIDNPVGGDDVFKNAWDTARRTASDRYNKLELSNIVRLARTDETTGFARRLAEPGTADALRQLSSTLDSKSIRQVTDAFKSDIARNLDTFGDKLQAFDPETLRRLLSPQEIKQFTEIATDITRLNSTGIQQALQNQTRNRLFVRDLIRRNDSAGASQLLEVIKRNGGRNGPMGRSVRAGIVDDFFEDVVRVQADGGRVTTQTLVERLEHLNNIGLRPLLNAKDRKTMSAVINIAPFVKVTRGGAGASIQAADVAENIISFGDPKSQISGLFSIIQKIGYARVMQRPAVRAALIGLGKQQVNPTRTLGLIGSTLATSLDELEQENSNGLE